ncbi:MAG: hypothetical protein ACYDEO_25450 [Aggregatilineales bacterium]
MQRERLFADKQMPHKQPRPAARTNDQLKSGSSSTRDELDRHAIDPDHLTASDMLHLQQTVGNQAVQRLLARRSQAQHQTTSAVQRYKTSRLWPGAKISDNGGFIFVGPKEIYASVPTLKRANEALAAVGALVKLHSVDDTTHNFNSVDYLRIGPTINSEVVKGKIGPLWTRLNAKQPGDGGYRSFADCFRTSGTVSGINPGARDQKEKLILKTGDIPLLTVGQAREKGGGDTPAARATLSFFLYAFPLFLGILKAQTTIPDTQTEIISQLAKYVALPDGPAKVQRGPDIYKLILAQPQAKGLLMSTYGINEEIVPAIGTALTQVNDEKERELEAQKEHPEDKWNFHWAGVILNDTGSKDYITLENCAVELSDATDAEIAINSDAFTEGALLEGETAMSEETKRARRGVKRQNFTKQDLINERWYYRLAGSGDDSFHEQNLKDPHATPSAITLNMGKA